MKKFLSIALMTILCCACVLGCGRFQIGGGDGGDDNPPNPEFVGKIDLPKDTKESLTILIPSGNANEKSMIDKCIDSFHNEYPDISITKSYVSLASYEDTIRNQAMVGTLPDIIWSNSPDFYYLVSNKLAQPLNTYLDQSEAAGVFDLEETFYKDFFDICSKDGINYCVPRSVDSVVTFYNKKILEDAKVDLSLIEDGWTWDTFYKVCLKVRKYLDDNNKRSHYVLDANLTTWLSVCYPILRSYGADVASPDGKIVLDSQATLDCMTMIHKMVEDRIIVESGEASGSSFEAGTSAFLFQSAAISLFADRKQLKGNIDIVSFPLIMANNAPKIGSGIAGYCINSRSEKKDAAWAFLNHMLTYEGQQAMALGGLNLPSIRRDLADFKTANWGKNYASLNLEAYTYGNEYKIGAEYLSYFNADYKPDLDQALRDLFANASNRNKTPAQSITQALQDIDDALSLGI